MRSTKTVLGSVGMFAALSLLIAGCGDTGGSGQSGESAGASGSGEEVKLTFMHPHSDTYDKGIELCVAQQPGLVVEQQAIPFNEMITQVQARLGAQDDSLDIIAVDPPRLGNMVYQGFLDPVPAANKTLTEEKVSEVGLNSATWEGEQYSYPIWTSVNFLMYNKEALDAAGVAHPSDDPGERMTWEEVLSDAKKVQDSGAAQYGLGIKQVDRYYAIQPLAMSMGADAGLGGDNGLEVDITSAEWTKFGDWYGQIHESGLAPRGIDASQMPDEFGTGSIAYMLSAPTRIGVFQESSLKDKWGIAPHPYFEGGDVATPTDSWGLGVSAFSKNKEAAHELLKCMSLTAEGVEAVTENYKLPPVNSEAFDQYIANMQASAPGALDNMEAIIVDDSENYAVHRPSSVGYVEFETAMNKALADIRNGQDPAQTLEATQSQLESQLTKYE